MGWKGAVRSIETGMRRAAREREREAKLRAKEAKLNHAAETVRVYEDYVRKLVSVHCDCSQSVNWKGLASKPEPPRPEVSNSKVVAATNRLENYRPGFLTRALKQAEKAQRKLQEAVTAARAEDERDHQSALKEWAAAHQEWEEETESARQIVSGEPDAMIKAIELHNPFKAISDLGSSLNFAAGEGQTFSVVLSVHGEEIVPDMRYSLLASGRLSEKPLAKRAFNELYQDYVCSSVLRVAREVFALLPIEIAVVTAQDDLLNTSTGHKEPTPILSVAVSRSTLSNLNLRSIDPSESIKNFVHKMNFKTTSGFCKVKPIDPADFPLEPTREIGN